MNKLRTGGGTVVGKVEDDGFVGIVGSLWRGLKDCCG